MKFNLTNPPSFTYKDVLLKKLYYSVICSVLSQLVILLVYILLSNVDVFHPLQWIELSLKTFTSFRTWLFMIPFLIIIFAHSIICAKDYVFRPSYCSTRFQKFVSAFSVHNLVLLLLHSLAGPMLIWLFLSLGGGDFQHLTTVTEEKTYVLNGGSFYLILSGFWTGFYYFIRVYMSEKHLSFPVIQQRKWLQFKSQMFPLLKQSFIFCIWPTIYFVIIYSTWGDILKNNFIRVFRLLPEENTSGFFVHFYVWCFSAIYYFNMNLMKFFFNIFLTEPLEFPLRKMSQNFLNLQDSIVLFDLPIIQNLACLDLYNLAQWSRQRRQVFFSLSQPGGHPHNWNTLAENVLKVFTEYIDILNKSTENKEVLNSATSPVVFQGPIQSPDKFRNLRNMSSNPQLVDFNFIHTNLSGFNVSETIFSKLKQKLNNFVSLTKVLLGIDFLFGELPQASIQKCLANGFVIIWTSQGISDLVCAALVEDKYGIVQKDIPSLLTILVHLKQNLDRLNKVSALTKRVVGYDDFNYRMKGAVTTAVKRSLLNICRTYRNYMNDFPLNRDVFLYLQSICKS